MALQSGREACFDCQRQTREPGRAGPAKPGVPQEAARPHPPWREGGNGGKDRTAVEPLLLLVASAAAASLSGGSGSGLCAAAAQVCRQPLHLAAGRHGRCALPPSSDKASAHARSLPRFRSGSRLPPLLLLLLARPGRDYGHARPAPTALGKSRPAAAQRLTRSTGSRTPPPHQIVAEPCPRNSRRLDSSTCPVALYSAVHMDGAMGYVCVCVQGHHHITSHHTH